MKTNLFSIAEKNEATLQWTILYQQLDGNQKDFFVVSTSQNNSS